MFWMLFFNFIIEIEWFNLKVININKGKKIGKKLV